MPDTVTVSVIIPHYNRLDLLKQTLNSVAYQTYQDWEVIIIDDYSNTDCINSIKDFISNEPRIKLITKNNQPKGAPASRNIGLKMANGEYVLFLDSDDILAPFALKQRIDKFENNNDVFHAVMAPTLIFSEFPGDTNEKWGGFNSKANVLECFLKGYSYFNTMSALWDKKFLIKIGGWDESLTSYQDWELHIRALFNGMNYTELSEYDNFYRTHSDTQSIAANFFKEDIIQGRFRAFALVYKQLIGSQNKHLFKPYRAFVLRQFIQLIDHDQCQTVKLFLKQAKDYGLHRFDKLILTKMLSDGYKWRYRRITRVLTQVFWKGLDYDPWLQNTRDKGLTDSNIKAMSFDYKYLLNNVSTL